LFGLIVYSRFSLEIIGGDFRSECRRRTAVIRQFHGDAGQFAFGGNRLPFQ